MADTIHLVLEGYTEVIMLPQLPVDMNETKAILGKPYEHMLSGGQGCINANDPNSHRPLPINWPTKRDIANWTKKG